ncbi:MAG: hypothetical protein R3C97_07650 [Geminicoccaceae bacterium]
MALLLLAGCSAGKPGVTVCPSAHVINGLDRQVLADGSLVTIGNIQGRCTVDGAAMTLDFAVDLGVEGAGTAAPRDLPVTYFIALIDEAGEPADKVLVETRVPLVPGVRKVVRESLDQEIADISPGAAAGWQVLIGLQLSREEALRQRRL